jgi:hypothetical protein
MLELEGFDGDESGTVFRDVIMLALAGFIAMVLLLLPHLNPPGEAAEENTQPPGNVIVEVRWPDELDSDVDLWVQAPGDVPAIPTRAAPSSTCCATISGTASMRPA